MSGLELWSTTAASNNSAPPNGWPEGQAPSSVNDCARQMMAAVRSWYENAEWINFGDTPTYVSGTSFTVATDLTARYQVGRRIKLVGTTPFTLYATIATSAYSAPNTTVILTMDSGAIDSTISIISLGINSVTNKSLSTSNLSGLGSMATQNANAVAITGGTVAATINELADVTIPSASTVNIGAAASNNIIISGSVTITGFDAVAAGITRKVKFSGILTLTYNGTSLILPSSANITTAANDHAIFKSLGSGNWECIDYQKADGTALVAAAGFTPTKSNALSGSVIQVVNVETGAMTSGTTTIPLDDTIPQSTEGDQVMTLAITPNNVSNLLKITVVVNFAVSASSQVIAALFQDSTANALAATWQTSDTSSANDVHQLCFVHYMTAGTISATTFKTRLGGQSGTITFNGFSAARKLGGILSSSMTIEEIKA